MERHLARRFFTARSGVGCCSLSTCRTTLLAFLGAASSTRTNHHRLVVGAMSTFRPMSTTPERAMSTTTTALSSTSLVVSKSFSLHDPSLLGLVDNDDQGHYDKWTVDSTTTAGGMPTFDVVDPGGSSQAHEDGTSVIARVRKMGREDTKAAIDRAAAALGPWKDGTTALHRSGIISKWSSLIKENTEDIAKIMTLESGKPQAESRGEVAYATSFLDYYAAEALRPNSAGGGSIIPTPFSTPDGAPRGKIMTFQEAVGVCALITPWNFPVAMITRKAGPALAVGCTAVIKPSELTPLTAIALDTLAKRAGVPEGVLEVITADRYSTAEVGAEFCTNPLIRKISFTGSTPVGKLLMKLSSDTVKRLSLELGGNAVFVVFEDADIDQAVDAAMASKFRNAGQTCVCADRFLVHKSIENEFLTKFAAAAKELSVGHGSKSGITMGPLITDAAADRVKEKVDKALAEGAECVMGGSLLPEIGPNYFEPTILRNVSTASLIHCSETFGPVAAVTTFETEEEALTIANAASTGLASYFCTNDMSRVFRFAASLENGIVGVNDGIISSASAPFGGVKESGLGREGSSSGLNEYLETKYVFLNA